MAVDRAALLKSIMLGYASPQELWCTAAQPGCSLDGVTPYSYDPDKARALLKKANFDFSKPFRFVGMAPGRVAASKETCEAIAEYLKRIGIQVDLQILEFGAWNQIKQAKQKDPNVGMIYATGPDPSKDVAYKLQVNTHSSLITSWVFDKENDEMLAKVNNFIDPKERIAFINKMLRRMHDEAYFLPLWANDTLYVTTKKVGLKVAPYLAFAPLEDVTKTA
jgi:peptide/nickel transport system substrate-binding protein